MRNGASLTGPWRRTSVFAGLGSLRPTERNEMEWSQRKVMSPASGAGVTVPILGASGVLRWCEPHLP